METLYTSRDLRRIERDPRLRELAEKTRVVNLPVGVVTLRVRGRRFDKQFINVWTCLWMGKELLLSRYSQDRSGRHAEHVFRMIAGIPF